MEFKKAVKRQKKLRCALTGPSGAGKTYTSLAVGSAMGKRIAVIDTERGSASLYSKEFPFDGVELYPATIDEYIKAIRLAGENGYDVLIVDSISHAWESLLDTVNQIATDSFRGNTFAAWSKGAPLQRKFIDAILSFPGHVFCTMRSKPHWDTESYEGAGGYKKNKPVKIGLAPEQKGNVEHEFDIVLDMDMDNVATISKTRYKELKGRSIKEPGEELGKELLEWLDDGEEVIYASEEQVKEVNVLIKDLNIDDTTTSKWLDKARVSSIDRMTSEQIDKCIDHLKSKVSANEPVKQEFDKIAMSIDTLSTADSFEELDKMFRSFEASIYTNETVIDFYESMKVKLFEMEDVA